jgi:acyl carrier protein
MVDDAALRETLKGLIVRTLNLEGVDPASIGDEQPLFGSGLGLDSVDWLELMVAIEKAYGFRLEANDADRAALASVSALARMVRGEMEKAGAGGP